ncbi:hypothetical protein SAMN02745206_00416 [Desulfacinum infernum DSM 9756]|uniref:Uncharacterized protein n=1 Tax=Desulfacinum infernum DSM 9756 TaxID=1121391 RepID=A0A1M4TYS0_9BACT|nr:hypothetical protein [Desulfacinum infernum]SHE49662.1 hypothetical protein SAMN02745206_00416 [Desulfacinum infernum DSM 9756]
MEREMREALSRGLEILRRIHEIYPQGEFDREMLHGEMDFRYRRIHELRRELEKLPPEVRSFCLLVDTAPVSEAQLAGLFRMLLQGPEGLAAAWRSPDEPGAIAAAQELGIPRSALYQILGRMKLSRLLDARHRLTPTGRALVEAYITLEE